jgi:phosphate starvation-inducible PhoH-like protein
MPRKKTTKKEEAFKIPQLASPGFKVENKKLTERQKEFLSLSLDQDTRIMFICGPAGSSKTYMAVYSALRHLSNNNDYDLMYIRTVIESADKGLGALPGDIADKFNPYIAPLKDKLDEMLPAKNTAPSVMKELMDERVDALPINFLRGANWIDKIVVADEAQNFTFKELTTLVTRLGKNSKLFICGDFMQSDINGKSGFGPMYDLFNDEDSKLKGIHCFRFTKDDIMRDELLKFIIGKLENKK